jgi:hypothetical protein
MATLLVVHIILKPKICCKFWAKKNETISYNEKNCTKQNCLNIHFQILVEYDAKFTAISPKILATSRPLMINNAHKLILKSLKRLEIKFILIYLLLPVLEI